MSLSTIESQVWVETMCKQSPTFMYWDFILRQETLVSQQTGSPSTYDCIILDGAATVHTLSTAGAKTFIEYANKIFIPYLSKQLRVANRLDVVWDSYFPDSLKESTRDKRGKGVRRKVSALTKLPTNWMDFLRDSMVWYRPPNKSTDINNLHLVFESLDPRIFSNFVLIGDFNINFCNPHHPLFNSLSDILSSFLLTQVVTQCTHCSHSGTSVM